MNLPTWVSIVGVFMIFLGGCGACNNLSKIKRPTDLKNSSEIFDMVKEEINSAAEEGDKNSPVDSISITMERNFDSLFVESHDIDSASLEKFQDVFGNLDEIMIFTEYYKKWIVRLGILGLIVSLIYLISGFLLVLGKPFSLKLSYLAIGLSCVFLIFQLVIMSMDKEGGAISKWSTSFGSYFMLLINIVIILIIVSSDKSYFQQHEIIEE